MRTADKTHAQGLDIVALTPGADLRSGRSLAGPTGATAPASPTPTSSGTRRRWRTFGVIGALLLVGGAAAVFVMFPRSRASFVADSMDAPDSIVAGEALVVDVHVRNTGDGGGEHEFTLLVDGEYAATSNVDLEAESGRTIELTVTDLDAGRHELSIEGFDEVHRSLSVLRPAEFVVDDLTVSPPQVDLSVDPLVTVHVDYSNIGEAPGSHSLQLTVDGRVEDQLEVRLDSDSSGEATFTLTMDTPGHKVLGVGDATTEIWVLAPAEFVVDDVVVSPPQVDLSVDPVVTAHVGYSNIGETAGTGSLRITLDGQLVEMLDVSADGGASGEATVSLTMDTPGHKVLGVGDATAEIWVLAPAELSIGSVTVTPNPANLTDGNLVTVTTRISNIGEIDGTFTLELSHGGSVVETRDVAVAAGQSIEQQFTVTLAFPGKQIVSVNGVQTEVEVYWLARPADGAVLVNELGGGSNLLTIENQRDEDVYVVLSASGEGQPPLLGVYVHAGSTQTVPGIRSGSYATFFVHGSAWCTYYQRFTADPDYGRFDEDSWFESSPSSYTVITLTFGASDGWSPTSSVDPADFPH